MTLDHVVGLRAFSRLEKEVQYFIAEPACRGRFIPGGTKRLIARNKSARELPEII